MDVKPLTHCSNLSFVASLHNPLRFLASYTIEVKRVLQEMCQKGIGCNDPLPAELKIRWEVWIKSFRTSTKFKSAGASSPQTLVKYRVELHHFSNASSRGYGLCSYISLRGKLGSFSSSSTAHRFNTVVLRSDECVH